MTTIPVRSARQPRTLCGVPVERLRAMLTAGMRMQELAEELNVSRIALWRALHDDSRPPGSVGDDVT